MQERSRFNERHYGVWEMPEMLSGVLAMLVVLWELCFVGTSTFTEGEIYALSFTRGLLCWPVLINTILVVAHGIHYYRELHKLSFFVILQLVVGVLGSIICVLAALKGNSLAVHFQLYWASVLFGLTLGIFALVNLGNFIRRRRIKRVGMPLSTMPPPVLFFFTMLALVVLSTLILMTPGGANIPISFTDAFFLTASAASNTGLATVDVASAFTPLGKAVLLIDIQIGAMGVMSFSYFVMMMVGKRLGMMDRHAFSGILDLGEVKVVPSLIKSIVMVSFIIEFLGAIFLYVAWKDMPGIPQDNLWAYAIFHSVSAFCNAGLSLFPANMAQACVAELRAAQAGMMLLMLAGTIGFGVYLEAAERLRYRFSKNYAPRRWSTHCWLVLRVSIIVILGGSFIMGLIGIFEPSSHTGTPLEMFWEALWNCIGRSTGFNISNISDYGPTYQLFLCLMMFIGGNPAGTGGGVFAPVAALCVLEVLRMLRGNADLELNDRCIARATVNRAMATVVFATAFVVVSTMILCMLEPKIAQGPRGMLEILFEQVSAFTTAGYSMGITAQLSDASKWFVSFSMIFGRVGVFTFIMVFIHQKKAKAIRYPETRMPLN